jgi:hypothetical protein
MRRIVTTSYRYKPPKKKKAVPLPGSATPPADSVGAGIGRAPRYRAGRRVGWITAPKP